MSNIAIENVSLPEGNMKQNWFLVSWLLRMRTSPLARKKIPSNIVEIMIKMSIANLR